MDYEIYNLGLNDTDGSKSIENVGYAVFLTTATKKYKLPPFTSIFTAELQAIATALYLAIDSNEKDILICSDSLSALYAIQKLSENSQTIKKIINYLIILSELNKSISFLWVPSHTGVPGNEAADIAAKEAAFMADPAPQIYEVNDVKAWLKNRIRGYWESMWSEVPLTNKLKAIKQTTERWRGYRREEIAPTRLRIGHKNLTHAHLITKVPFPHCQTCKAPLTVKHLIEDCRRYDREFEKLKIPRNASEALKDSTEGNSSFYQSIIC